KTHSSHAGTTAMLLGIAACIALAFWATLYKVYKLCKTKTTFFKDLGIPGPRPHPIYGNLREVYKQGTLKVTEEWASEYGDVVGYFHGFRPVMIIRDPELLKQIFIRNFDSFTARQQIVELSNVLNVNTVKLTRISGDKWRKLRALTSPAFKSSTLKRAFSIIDECADEFLEIMEQTAQKLEGLDISKHFSRLSMDILSRFTMGVQINAQAASKETELLINCARGSVGQFAFTWIIFF
ncbi:unnamed protein product, partial [Ixodes pacificus]